MFFEENKPKYLMQKTEIKKKNQDFQIELVYCCLFFLYWNFYFSKFITFISTT